MFCPVKCTVEGETPSVLYISLHKRTSKFSPCLLRMGAFSPFSSYLCPYLLLLSMCMYTLPCHGKCCGEYGKKIIMKLTDEGGGKKRKGTLKSIY